MHKKKSNASLNTLRKHIAERLTRPVILILVNGVRIAAHDLALVDDLVLIFRDAHENDVVIPVLQIDHVECPAWGEENRTPSSPQAKGSSADSACELNLDDHSDDG